MSRFLRFILTAVIVSVAALASAATASASGAPVLSWSPSTGGNYDYGTLNPGSTASTAFTLKNSGGKATSALKITLSGSAAFTKTADTCTGTSLGPNKTCTVTIRYAPTSNGQSDTAALVAASNKAPASASLTLVGASNVVSVTSPGSQTSTVGTAVSLQIQATDSAGLTLSYAATGLPTGLSINASSGVISGTPTTAKTYDVRVTVSDFTGGSGSATFTWTVNPFGG
jgi:hypothetical protein